MYRTRTDDILRSRRFVSDNSLFLRLAFHLNSQQHNNFGQTCSERQPSAESILLSGMIIPFEA
jgi:hypothetical protein